MNVLWVSLLIVFTAGVLALAAQKKFVLMKTASVLFLTTGCLSGLLFSSLALWWAETPSYSFTAMKYIDLSFKIDSFSAFFLIIIFAISLISALYSYHYMNEPEKRLAVSAHYFFYSILVISMVLVVMANTMITFMISWELMSLSSFFLVIHDHTLPENRKAGYLYFIFSHIGAMFIFAAFGVALSYTGSFGFEGFKELPDSVKLVIFILAFIGFGSKAGVFPFHVWLPHAHPAAPSHVSALMSGVMIKIGVYGIVRIYTLLECQGEAVGMIVLIAGAVTGVLGVVYALGQHDMKRFLAYSSVENIGIILIGLGTGMIGIQSGDQTMAMLGFTGGLFHVLNHSIFKPLLFFGAGMVLHQTGTRLMDKLGGLLKSMKITGTAFLVGSLAISGLPPFNGFASEFLIYLGAFTGAHTGHTPFVAGMIAILSLGIIGGLALACFTKVFGVVFQGEPRSSAAKEPHEHGATMLFSMTALAVLCTVIGVFPGLFVTIAVKALSSFSFAYERIPLEPFLQITGDISRTATVFIGFILIVGLVRKILYIGKPIGKMGTWGCGFTRPTVKMQYSGSSFAGSIMEFFRPVAPLVEEHTPIQGRFPSKTAYHSRFEDIAERHTMTLIVRPVLWIFDRLRWIQHGEIHLYIGYIFLAIVVLLFFI